VTMVAATENKRPCLHGPEEGKVSVRASTYQPTACRPNESTHARPDSRTLLSLLGHLGTMCAFAIRLLNSGSRIFPLIIIAPNRQEDSGDLLGAIRSNAACLKALFSAADP
jgi:hypothetical protein